MSQPATQAVANLPSDVLLGVGWLFDDNTHIGISRGGLTFEPNVERRNIPYDGKMSNAEELDWDTFSEAQITGTFIQFVSKVGLYEPGNTTTSPGGSVTSLITPHEAGVLYEVGDYVRNLRYVFARLSGGYVQVRFFSALVSQYSIAGVDREEATIAATFSARNLLADIAAAPGKKPYVIELLSAFS
jgi:hypothetical protein